MDSLGRKLIKGAGFASYTLGVQYPVRVLYKLFGPRIWEPLSTVTANVSGLMGKLSGLTLSKKDIDPIEKARILIDTVEENVGIYGDWEIKDAFSGIKRIESCPYACRWGKASEFCGIVGEVMGQKSIEALFPEMTIDYTIKSTLAGGDSLCEYHLNIIDT